MLYQPAPSIRPGSVPVNLLTSTAELPDRVRAYDKWRSGLTWRSIVSLSTDVGPQPCGTTDWPEPVEDPDEVRVTPFTIRAIHGCEGLVDSSEYESEITDALDDQAPWLIAREFWTGSQGGQSLQSTATAIGGTGDVSGVIDDLIANHQDATKGGRTIIHIPRRALSGLARDLGVKRAGTRLLLPDDTVVIPGPGYPNAPGNYGPLSDPDDLESGTPAASGQLWIYATGPVMVGRGPVQVSDAGEGVAARQNLVEFYAQQPAIVAFDSTHVFAGLADL